MKKMFLLIVVPVLLVTLGFAQTPAPNSNVDQPNLKGCLGGSEGNYTVAQDGTSQNFKVTSSTVDLKGQLGHDVEIVGQTANAATGSGSSDNSVTVTGVTMIADHCTPAVASTPAADPTPTAAASTPAVADPTPAAAPTTSVVADPTPAVAASTPAVAADPTPAAAASTPVVADPTPAAAQSEPTAARKPTPENSERIPDTASSLPLLGLLGFGLLTAGLISRRFWTNQR